MWIPSACLLLLLGSTHKARPLLRIQYARDSDGGSTSVFCSKFGHQPSIHKRNQVTRLNPDKSHIWRRNRVPALIAWWCRRSKNYKIAQDEDINNLEAIIRKEDIRGCSDQICSVPLPYSHHLLAHRSSWWALCRWRWLCQSHWFEAEKRNRIGKLLCSADGWFLTQKTALDPQRLQ